MPETKTQPANKSATLEDTMPPKWTMPKPQRGQSVIFHRYGIPNQTTDVVATVLAVSVVNVDLLVHGMVHETVRHCDDPRIQGNAELRSNGTWDFNDYDKAVEARLSRLEELLK